MLGARKAKRLWGNRIKRVRIKMWFEKCEREVNQTEPNEVALPPQPVPTKSEKILTMKIDSPFPERMGEGVKGDCAGTI